MNEELKELIEDLHKDELSKIGKIKLEKYIRCYQRKLDKIKEVVLLYEEMVNPTLQENILLTIDKEVKE